MSTDRPMLLTNDRLKAACDGYVANGEIKEPFAFSLGAVYARSIYEEERVRLLAELERLKAALENWEAFRKGNPFLSAWDGEGDPTTPLPKKGNGE